VRDLRVQYDSGTLSTDDKAAIESEVKALGTEIKDITTKTEFNDINLLAMTSASGVTFQVGANTGETITVAQVSLSGAISTGGTGGLSEIIAFSAGATGFSAVDLDELDNAIKNVSSKRSDFGAVQNRLEHRLNNLATYQENLVASESRIRDVDMASEMVNFTKLGILQQAGTSMLAQANQAPQGVLSLLR
jgi:flagellin